MIRNLVLSTFILFGSSASAEEVGLLQGVDASVISPCGQLLVTGQFFAPSDVTTIEIKPKAEQASVTVLELEVTNEISDGADGTQLLPYSFSTENHPCPYGVSVSFKDQTVLVGLSVAQTARARKP